MDSPASLQAFFQSSAKARVRIRIDWLAATVGGLAGGVWWVLHKMYFVPVYWANVQFQIDGFALTNLKFALLQGATIGFLTAVLARKRPYLSSLAALFFAFMLKTVFWIPLYFSVGIVVSVEIAVLRFMFRLSPSTYSCDSWAALSPGMSWSPPDPYWWKLFYAAYFGSLFGGAFAGQAVKRHRKPNWFWRWR